MATFSAITLSGATTGVPIIVAANASPGTVVHLGTATSYDEVYLFASNVTASAATLYIQWGVTTDPGGMMVKNFSITANSAPVPIAVGQRINGAVTVLAFCTAASAINITGWVNRIT